LGELVVQALQPRHLLLEPIVLLVLEDTLLPKEVQFFIELGDHIVLLQLLIDVVIFLPRSTQLGGKPIHDLLEHSVERLLLVDLELPT